MVMKHMLRHWLSRFARKPASYSAPPDTRIYAVGDIHGRDALLEELLEFIQADAKVYPGQKIIEVFLGDYIDRGPNSARVLELLSAPPPAGHTRICLKGNHEQVMLQFLKQNPLVLRDWMQFGGLATLSNYGLDISRSPDPFAIQKEFAKALPEHHRTFLNELKVSAQLGDYYFVHAGIHPKKALDAQSEADQLWIRDTFLSHRKCFSAYIVHGHTPCASPELHPHRANLDVSDAPQTSLACLILWDDQRQIKILQENVSS